MERVLSEVALASCNLVAYGEWFDSTVLHEDEDLTMIPCTSKARPLHTSPLQGIRMVAMV
jgi:hypothetical protein